MSTFIVNERLKANLPSSNSEGKSAFFSNPNASAKN